MRNISYSQAINEALHQMMDSDEKVLLIGQGVTSPWYVGATTTGLLDKFGPERIFDTPVSENATTGVAVGAALAGMRPIIVYPRMDFMLYAMDQIVNHAANWHYMFGGQTAVPLVVWGIINRGGAQAAQHAQALQAMFAHIPGLKVVMPSTPYDAKGLLIASIKDNNPVVFIDDRWLYNNVDEVPEAIYTVPIGKAKLCKEGSDATIVSTSYMIIPSLQAAHSLKSEGINIEVLDLRTVKPIDEEAIMRSVRKTGRLIVADAGWRTCGLGAEIAALAVEKAFTYLKAPILRISLPDSPAPASSVLEKKYYPDANKIINAVKKLLG
jgi:pyruvate/2-oxoglutarate/acetoin dehydrogenase E1 component